ncbi:unnamed protein product [Caenorhabditis sp. 36 PRJEB53466]|nr:unnamed protein product [Caenorhabditis sp. 36 PRJEB53466]
MTTKLDFSTADLINCTICIREFTTTQRKPKVLHCGHTVCESCILELLSNAAFTPQTTVRCPVCRTWTTRAQAQQFVTNFQIMGFLAEKEKIEKEKAASSAKGNKVDERLQFRMGRDRKMKIHVASKKDLKSPEMYVRRDAAGSTTVVFAGKTGSTTEIMKFINENGFAVETGKVFTRVVHDEGNGREPERFSKVNEVGAGQSALKCAGPPSKLEEVEISESYELKAVEEDGKIRLELVWTGEKPEGFQVFGGTMAKPNQKRLKAMNEPSTSTAGPSTSADAASDGSEAPVAKRTRRGRGNFTVFNHFQNLGGCYDRRSGSCGRRPASCSCRKSTTRLQCLLRHFPFNQTHSEDAQSSRVNRSLPCPTCRQLNFYENLANPDIAFPTNYSLRELIEKHEVVEQQGGQTYACTHCNSMTHEKEMAMCETCKRPSMAHERKDFMKRPTSQLLCFPCARANHNGHAYADVENVRGRWKYRTKFDRFATTAAAEMARVDRLTEVFQKGITAAKEFKANLEETARQINMNAGRSNIGFVMRNFMKAANGSAKSTDHIIDLVEHLTMPKMHQYERHEMLGKHLFQQPKEDHEQYDVGIYKQTLERNFIDSEAANRPFAPNQQLNDPDINRLIGNGKEVQKRMPVPQLMSTSFRSANNPPVLPFSRDEYVKILHYFAELTPEQRNQCVDSIRFHGVSFGQLGEVRRGLLNAVQAWTDNVRPALQPRDRLLPIYYDVPFHVFNELKTGLFRHTLGEVMGHFIDKITNLRIRGHVQDYFKELTPNANFTRRVYLEIKKVFDSLMLHLAHDRFPFNVFEYLMTDVENILVRFEMAADRPVEQPANPRNVPVEEPQAPHEEAQAPVVVHLEQQPVAADVPPHPEAEEALEVADQNIDDRLRALQRQERGRYTFQLNDLVPPPPAHATRAAKRRLEQANATAAAASNTRPSSARRSPSAAPKRGRRSEH